MTRAGPSTELLLINTNELIAVPGLPAGIPDNNNNNQNNNNNDQNNNNKNNKNPEHQLSSAVRARSAVTEMSPLAEPGGGWKRARTCGERPLLTGFMWLAGAAAFMKLSE